MQKKYLVRLTDQERIILTEVIKKLKGTSQKVRPAHMLLKADADGAAWTDRKIADASSCRTKTVENVRQHFVERGFEETLDGKKRSDPPTEKLLDGEQEAKIIATRLGPPPQGYASWTLRLLARKVVELEIVESVSRQTLHRTLKRRHDQSQNSVLGDPAGSRCRVRGQHGRGPRNLLKTLRS